MDAGASHSAITSSGGMLSILGQTANGTFAIIVIEFDSTPESWNSKLLCQSQSVSDIQTTPDFEKGSLLLLERWCFQGTGRFLHETKWKLK